MIRTCSICHLSRAGIEVVSETVSHGWIVDSFEIAENLFIVINYFRWGYYAKWEDISSVMSKKGFCILSHNYK